MSNNYTWFIYIVLGVMSRLETTSRTWEDVLWVLRKQQAVREGACASSSLGFWCPRGWEGSGSNALQTLRDNSIGTHPSLDRQACPQSLGAGLGHAATGALTTRGPLSRRSICDLFSNLTEQLFLFCLVRQGIQNLAM